MEQHMGLLILKVTLTLLLIAVATLSLRRRRSCRASGTPLWVETALKDYGLDAEIYGRNA
jgi:hypothetical protein